MEFLGRHRNMFATDLSELGSTNVYHHRIETGDAPPVKKRFYRQSIQMRQEIEKQIDNLVKHKILEPSTSEWNSPIVMCKKKDGTYRMACDFRELNKVSQPLHYLCHVRMTFLTALVILKLSISAAWIWLQVFGRFPLILKLNTKLALLLIMGYGLGISYLLA